MEAPAGLVPSITGLWCEAAELNCTIPYFTKASVLTFALRCHIMRRYASRTADSILAITPRSSSTDTSSRITKARKVFWPRNAS